MCCLFQREAEPVENDYIDLTVGDWSAPTTPTQPSAVKVNAKSYVMSLFHYGLVRSES